jgi:hypothetical protein
MSISVQFNGFTPLLFAFYNSNVEVVKTLLKDSRVDLNLGDHCERTPLWWGCEQGCEQGFSEVIKWTIVLRGDQVDVEKKGEDLDGNEYSAIEIARERDPHGESLPLLERFKTNPIQTKHEIRVELGLIDALAAEVFGIMVFLCDGFLRIKSGRTRRSTQRPETTQDSFLLHRGYLLSFR